MIRRVLAPIGLLLLLATMVVAADRPNIVWIVSEDNSIHYLAHFFDGGAAAPQIESLAAHGLTFDHAYSNAPVCSVARTTLGHRLLWAADRNPVPSSLRTGRDARRPADVPSTAS